MDPPVPRPGLPKSPRGKSRSPGSTLPSNERNATSTRNYPAQGPGTHPPAARSRRNADQPNESQKALDPEYPAMTTAPGPAIKGPATTQTPTPPKARPQPTIQQPTPCPVRQPAARSRPGQLTDRPIPSTRPNSPRQRQEPIQQPSEHHRPEAATSKLSSRTRRRPPISDALTTRRQPAQPETRSPDLRRSSKGTTPGPAIRNPTTTPTPISPATDTEARRPPAPGPPTSTTSPGRHRRHTCWRRALGRPTPP